MITVDSFGNLVDELGNRIISPIEDYDPRLPGDPFGWGRFDPVQGLPGGYFPGGSYPVGTYEPGGFNPGTVGPQTPQGAPVGYNAQGMPIYSTKVELRQLEEGESLLDVGVSLKGNKLYLNPYTGVMVEVPGPGQGGETATPPVDTSGTQVTPGGAGVKPGDLGTIASTTVTGMQDIATQPVDLTGWQPPTDESWRFMWPGQYAWPGLTIGDQTPIFRTDATEGWMWPGRYVYPGVPTWTDPTKTATTETKTGEEKKTGDKESTETTTTGGGGGGGGTEKPDEKKPAVQVPILPIPQGSGAPGPGPFAPMVGLRGMQTLFGGQFAPNPLVPFLNQMLAGGF